MKKIATIIIVFILLIIIFFFFYPFKSLTFLSSQSTIDIKNLTGEFDFRQTEVYFNNQLIKPPVFEFKPEPVKMVLGESDKPKRIEVDLINQRLYAYEGSQKIYDFLISSGKWGRTPVGNFRIWTKFRYSLMTGGSKILKTYYYLPNVPYVIFFYNNKILKMRGFSLHGTYWHSNFGQPMSHGCINMKTEEAEVIYYWAQPDLQGKKSILASSNNPGTEVFIYGTAPK